MPRNLVIVESPAKAKTIEKYLGKDFEVLASYGHVRDLVPKEGAVDPTQGYKMKYRIIERNEKHVNAIVRALKKADALYLATDPDREGEAISWHLYELLREKKALGEKPVHRVVFYEITKQAVKDAIADPRELSSELVNAQQARRALDYLVGFNLSPLLWKKVQPGLSAGRVQSPALRMIVERELEIEAFNPREYWTLEADVSGSGQGFMSRLTQYQGDKVEQFSFVDEKTATGVRESLLSAADGNLHVTAISRKQRRRNPTAPFTTSTLQQEASRKLGFNTQRTMRTAQKLYEGIEIPGEGTVGLITYMRTDSPSIAQVAIEEIRDVIAERYGKDNVPAEQREYRTKSKNAQEAHEAIRPTSSARDPESLRASLDEDQFKLYSLIWRRSVASQMIPAVFDTVAVDLAPGAAPGPQASTGNFRANGSILVTPGFISVYQEGQDDSAGDDNDRRLPEMKEGDVISLTELRADQHFTEPPPRFTEASLVKTLEEFGIGRPSTYASIISTLKNREYVEMDGKRFLPTDIGRIVNGFLTDHFTQYVDYEFTARMEDDLDAVSRGDREWVPLLDEFWQPFTKQVDDKEKSVSREQVAQSRDLGIDPKSGKPVSVRMGRFGPFVQIGTKDDEEKPKFAGLRPGQKMNDVDLETALDLFQLPRKLGETPEGEAVSASIGRFGPYVRYDNKFVSIKGDDDPYTITLERALEVITEKKIADANRLILDFPDDGIQVLNGRYGPYITNKKKNAKIPKDREPKSLTLEECKELLEAAPERGRRGKKASKKTAAADSKKKVTKKKATKKKTAKKKTTKKKTAKKTATKKKATKKKAVAKKTSTKKADDA
ncbi:MAG: DNA topoisomerase I [Pseudomonadota bacterium]